MAEGFAVGTGLRGDGCHGQPLKFPSFTWDPRLKPVTCVCR